MYAFHGHISAFHEPEQKLLHWTIILFSTSHMKEIVICIDNFSFNFLGGENLSSIFVFRRQQLQLMYIIGLMNKQIEYNIIFHGHRKIQ